MRVFNINMFPVPMCPTCGPWHYHWEKIAGKGAHRCCEQSCDNMGDCPAVVQKEDRPDAPWFVVVVSPAHAKVARSMDVKDDTIFVSVDPNPHCRKSPFLY